MTTSSPPSHVSSASERPTPPQNSFQYNHSPSKQEAPPATSQIRFPSSSPPESRPALSSSSSSWSTSTYASSNVRDNPTTPTAHRHKGFRLPRFSLWGRSTPDTLPDDHDVCVQPSADLATDLNELHISKERSHSSPTSIDVLHVAPEAVSTSRPSSPRSVTPMPALTVIAPTSPSPMSSPKLASVWRLGGGLFASSASSGARRRDSSQIRRNTAGSSPPSDPAIVPPESQFAAWSELMQGSPLPDRSGTFSSFSSTSCSGCSRPRVKKICSQDSIQTSASAQPLDADPSTSYRHSLVPVPKAVKLKLRSKVKASQEPDFGKVFLAQELRPPSTNTPVSSLGRSASGMRSASVAPAEHAAPSAPEHRRKRSSWTPGPSIARRTSFNRQSVDLDSGPSLGRATRSSDGYGSTEPQHAQRGRIERQMSTGSYLNTIASTAASSSSHSSASDNALPPLSPSMTGDLDIPGDSRAKRAKAATPKRRTYAMQFSPDGRYLALAGSDHLIRVYEVISSPCDRAEEVQLAQALRAEEAAQRKNSSTCSQGSHCMDRSNTKMDVRAGATELAPVFKSTPLHVFAGHSGDILDLSWSKNNFLLSCGSDKTAKLWHPNREDCLCTFTTSAVVSSIDFHPTDDRFFVTGGLDGKLRLWNISARRVQSLTNVPDVITAVSFSSSGAVVCVGTQAGSVLTFSCTNSLSYLNAIKVKSAAASKSTQPSKITCIQPIRLDACSPEVKAAASSRSAAPTKGEPEYMIVTSNDSRVRIYSIASHRLMVRLKATSYVNRNSQIRATTSTDGQFVVSGSDDASIHVWSLASNASLFGNLFSGIKRNKSIVKSGVGDLGDNSTWRSWQAGAGSVRCAIFAPTATAELLAAAEDPLEREKGEVAAVRARIIVSTDDSNAIRVWRCDPLGQLV